MPEPEMLPPEREIIPSRVEPPTSEPAVESISTPNAPKQKHVIGGAWTWVRSSRKRTMLTCLIAAVFLAGIVIATTDLRYSVLGLFVTGTVEAKVMDSSTNQAVPKALVSFGSVSGLTDNNGLVILSKAKLGRGSLSIHKTGYNDTSVKTLAGLRKSSAVNVVLVPNGVKIMAQVTNSITGEVVGTVEVKSGDASALTDSSGHVELSLPLGTINSQQKLAFTKDGYNELDQEVMVKAGGSLVTVKLTPSGKVYFQSNRSGRIDIYGSNLDGTATEVVLSGTGTEDTATGILTSLTDQHTIALVSSRDGQRGGSLHHDLFILNTDSRKLTKIDSDVDFSNFRTFIGSVLVYEKSKTLANYYGCSDIKTYDVATGKSATFFNGDPQGIGCPTIKLALGDNFIYSVRASQDPSQTGIFDAKLSGTPKHISPLYTDGTVRRTKQTLLSEYYTGNQSLWDSIKLDNFTVSRLPNGPSIETSRYYNDSPDAMHSAFIEERDGKSELYLTDSNGENEKKLTAIGSANQFVQWYGEDYIVFSSTKTNENALYVVSINGGVPIKISDFYRGNERTYGGGGNPYN
jgi:hypothetical protein